MPPAFSGSTRASRLQVIEAMRAALTAEQIGFLYGLPPAVQIAEMFFCHARPRNDVVILTERTPEERIAHLFADVDVDVFVGDTARSGSVRRPPKRKPYRSPPSFDAG